MLTIHSSKDPLKDGLAKVTAANLDQITRIGKPFVRFEGTDKCGKYFRFRLHYDSEKRVHVDVTINDNEKHQYLAANKDYTWYMQVLNNINGH